MLIRVSPDPARERTQKQGPKALHCSLILVGDTGFEPVTPRM